MAEDEVQLVKDDKDEVTDLEKIGNESPIIRFVNYLLFDALKQGASDIHIEPKEKSLKIRYRIDGILFEAMSPPHNMQAAVISRIKIMSNLDIAERRLPQDGRIRCVIHNRKIDLRVSTLPTPYGEVRHPYPRQQIDQRRAGRPGLQRKLLHHLAAPRSTCRTGFCWSPDPPVREKPPRSTPRCAAWTATS